MARINEIDRPTDAVFLLFYYAKEIRGITKVQKLLFLIEKETEFGQRHGKNITLDFKPYKMGPFSAEVYDEIELLRSMNAIEIEEMSKDASDAYEFSKWNELFKGTEGDSEGLSNKIFNIKDKGEKIGESLSELLSDSERQDLETTIQNYNSMTLMSLLEYVYTEYEDMTTKSEIIDQVMNY